MKRVALLVAVLALAGCGGTKPISSEHATLTDVRVHGSSVDFTFDSAPQSVKHAYAARDTLAECGSGMPVRPNGAAFLVVHFQPAQTLDVPKRIVMPSGVVLDVWKVCDFEADVGWAIGLAHRAPVAVTRHDHQITLTFG